MGIAEIFTHHAVIMKMFDLPLVKFNNLIMDGILESMTYQPILGRSISVPVLLLSKNALHTFSYKSLINRFQYFMANSLIVPSLIYASSANEIYYRNNPVGKAAFNRINEDMWVSEEFPGLKWEIQQPMNI